MWDYRSSPDMKLLFVSKQITGKSIKRKKSLINMEFEKPSIEDREEGIPMAAAARRAGPKDNEVEGTPEGRSGRLVEGLPDTAGTPTYCYC